MMTFDYMLLEQDFGNLIICEKNNLFVEKSSKVGKFITSEINYSFSPIELICSTPICQQPLKSYRVSNLIG